MPAPAAVVIAVAASMVCMRCVRSQLRTNDAASTHLIIDVGPAEVGLYHVQYIYYTFVHPHLKKSDLDKDDLGNNRLISNIILLKLFFIKAMSHQQVTCSLSLSLSLGSNHPFLLCRY